MKYTDSLLSFLYIKNRMKIFLTRRKFSVFERVVGLRFLSEVKFGSEI